MFKKGKLKPENPYMNMGLSFDLCTYGRCELGFIIMLYVDDIAFFIWHIYIQLCLRVFN